MCDSAMTSTGLMTDLYHPDAAYISWRTGRNAPTTFDLYTRTAPFDGAYLLVAGLEVAHEIERHFRYTDGDIAYLRQIRDYDDRFLRRKEVYRIGDFAEDVVQLEGEPVPAQGQRLLRPVMQEGEALPGSTPPIAELWELAQHNLARLPDRYKALSPADPYPVRLSRGLQELRERTGAHYRDSGESEESA